MTISKCKHGIYLDGCRKCYPLPDIKVTEEDFEEWAPLLSHLLECNQLRKENEYLRNQIKHLESQVYGGTTK